MRDRLRARTHTQTRSHIKYIFFHFFLFSFGTWHDTWISMPHVCVCMCLLVCVFDPRMCTTVAASADACMWFRSYDAHLTVYFFLFIFFFFFNSTEWWDVLNKHFFFFLILQVSPEWIRKEKRRKTEKKNKPTLRNAIVFNFPHQHLCCLLKDFWRQLSSVNGVPLNFLSRFTVWRSFLRTTIRVDDDIPHKKKYQTLSHAHFLSVQIFRVSFHLLRSFCVIIRYFFLFCFVVLPV